MIVLGIKPVPSTGEWGEMINDNEVREALKEVKKVTEGVFAHDSSYIRSLDVLTDLAESYLKAGKEMPEKKEIGEMRYGGCNPDFDKGYNQAIEDCTLVHMKREADLLEKIRLLQAEVDVERSADWKGYAKHLEQKQAEWEKKMGGWRM